MRLVSGNYSIVVDNLDAVHLPRSGCLDVTIWKYIGTSVWDIVTSPVDGGTLQVEYEGIRVIIPVIQEDTYKFEFDV